MIDKVEVRTFKHYARCNCGGTYKWLCSQQGYEYLHICDKCRDKKLFSKIYPYTSYEEIKL